MRPLTLDDLLPLDEYGQRRRECFESHSHYLDRYRRVRIGPRVTLIFENRQTLWFRIQEILRIARLAEPAHVQEELDLYNRLLPGRNQLQAALLLGADDEPAGVAEASLGNQIQGECLNLCVGDHFQPAQLITCRPEDRCAGASFWVQFRVDGPARRLLGDFRRPARFEMRTEQYQHESAPLSEDVRQSLLDDLELSDRDRESA